MALPLTWAILALLSEALVVCVAGNVLGLPGTMLPVTRAIARIPWVPSLGALLRRDPSRPKLPGRPRTFPTPPKRQLRLCARDCSDRATVS